MPRDATRAATAVACLLIAGLAGGCTRGGSLSTGEPDASVAPSRSLVISSGMSNQQAADRDADRILAAFPVPRGAIRIAGRPAGTDALAQAPSQPAVSALVDKTSWWILSGEARSVRSTISATVPTGAALLGTDEATGPGTTNEYGVTFYWPVIPGILDERLLQAAATDVDGHVVLRVDAMVTWLPARPPGVTIPAGATVVTVTLVPRMWGTVPIDPKQYGPVTITDAPRVARVVALINTAYMAQIGVYHCPADFGGSLRLEFRSSPTGPVLDRVIIVTSGCGGMTVKASDGTTARLTGSSDVADQIETILGLPWPKA